MISARLFSAIGIASQCPIFTAPYACVIDSVVVWFFSKPDAGNLDVGTDPTDPDEIVDNFNLTTLTNKVPKSIPLVGSSLASGEELWAKVSGAGASAGSGGGITVNFHAAP